MQIMFCILAHNQETYFTPCHDKLPVQLASAIVCLVLIVVLSSTDSQLLLMVIQLLLKHNTIHMSFEIIIARPKQHTVWCKGHEYKMPL